MGEEGVEEGAEGTPMLCPSVQDEGDVRPPILTFCGKSKPRLFSLWISLWGVTMLNAELNSTNSTLTYVLC